MPCVILAILATVQIIIPSPRPFIYIFLSPVPCLAINQSHPSFHFINQSSQSIARSCASALLDPTDPEGGPVAIAQRNPNTPSPHSTTPTTALPPPPPPSSFLPYRQRVEGWH
ncbi:MAG: hypothetical protein Q9187_003610 [Circinaria calcarea]